MIFGATFRPHGPSLLRHEDGAHAPFADLLQKFVRSDHRAGAFPDWLIDGADEVWCGAFQEAARFAVDFKEMLYLFAQLGVITTGFGDVARPLLGRQFANCVQK